MGAMMSAQVTAISGLNAASLTLNASASNLANADDVSAVGGAPAYSPIGVQQSAQPGGGVVASAVTLKPSQLLAYDPNSPVANAVGLVQAPEIDPVAEITNQLLSGQNFAYSLAALKAANEEQQTLLDMTT
jgi:flagellar basal-body rod protein FlgC